MVWPSGVGILTGPQIADGVKQKRFTGKGGNQQSPGVVIIATRNGIAENQGFRELLSKLILVVAN